MLQLFVVLGILEVMLKVALGQLAGDTLTANRSITDKQTLISTGGIFQLGFFSPSSSTNKYLGIWYYNMPDQTVIWVANRDNPLNTSVGTLNLTADGNLVLYSGNIKIWSSGTLRTINPVLQLWDSGNLVLAGGSSNNTVWQSFDYPCDTFLPGMKLGVDFKMDLDKQLRSWKSANNPSFGDYSYTMETHGVPKTIIRKGSSLKWRSGPWDGQSFSGRPDMAKNSLFQFEYASNQDEVYYSFKSADSSVLTRVVLNGTGVLQRALWSKGSNSWDIFWTCHKTHAITMLPVELIVSVTLLTQNSANVCRDLSQSFLRIGTLGNILMAASEKLLWLANWMDFCYCKILSYQIA